MIVRECKMIEVTPAKPSLVGMFLIGSLVGLYQKRGLEEQKCLPLLARLIDKAVYEYQMSHQAALDEEAEGKLTYADIEKRNKGQYLYTTTITNHFENCLNAVRRAYKILDRIRPEASPAKKSVIDTRNVIEHIDKEIFAAGDGPTSLEVSEDGTVIAVMGQKLNVDDLAQEIERLKAAAQTILK